MDTQRCGVYQRAALIWGPALIRGNTVTRIYSFDTVFGIILVVEHFGKLETYVNDIYSIRILAACTTG